MIFRRATLREFAANATAVFLVVAMITLTTLLIRLLGEAASGGLAAEAVITMLGFSALDYLPILLSLTLFIAVLMTLTRSYRDSEMVVWFCSGLSITAWVRPVTVFALPVVFTIALTSVVLSPWAVRKGDELRAQMESRDEAAAVSPGAFQESKQSDRVYFVENYSGSERRVRNVFANTVQNQNIGTMTAKEGLAETQPNGDRYLVLLNGRRYEGLAGSNEYKILDFKRYAMRIEAYEATRRQPAVKSLNVRELLRLGNSEALAELGWRLSIPFSALLLSLAAIPLSFVNPRAGRSVNLVLALLVYMVYSNGMSIAKAWVTQQKLSLIAGMLGVHAAMFLLLIFLFYRRISVYSLFRLRNL